MLTVGTAGVPHEIALPDLGTVSTIPLNNTWKNLYYMPHTHVDPRTDELVLFAFALSSPFLRLGCLNKDGKMRYEMTVPGISKPTIFHDFALTENYIVFFLCPVQFQVSMSHKLFGGVPPTSYDCTENTMLGIMRRYPPGVKKVNAPLNEDGEGSELDELTTESIKWIAIKSCYITHIANAYEQDAETLVIYATKTPQYLDTSYGGAHSNEAALPEHKTSLCRFVVDLEFSEIREHTMLNHVEHPVCRTEFYGSKNQFVYCLEFIETTARIEDPDVPLYKSVVKIDLNNQNKKHFFFGSNRFGGEVKFVPKQKIFASDFHRNPDVLKKKQEDDGYLLCFVYDEISESTDLVVIDAQTMDEAFSLSLPNRVPYGFHTEYVSREECSRAIPKPWK
uniref:Uncharacterized protein n=1 Tax=Percolomonas cosmopolitus TaxID=63605 RepID=A0A7S1KWN0_9EUKA